MKSLLWNSPWNLKSYKILLVSHFYFSHLFLISCQKRFWVHRMNWNNFYFWFDVLEKKKTFLLLLLKQSQVDSHQTKLSRLLSKFFFCLFFFSSYFSLIQYFELFKRKEISDEDRKIIGGSKAFHSHPLKAWRYWCDAMREIHKSRYIFSGHRLLYLFNTMNLFVLRALNLKKRKNITTFFLLLFFFLSLLIPISDVYQAQKTTCWKRKISSNHHTFLRLSSSS